MRNKMLALALVALLALLIVPTSRAGVIYDDTEIVIDSTNLYPKTDGGSTLGKSGNEFAGLHVDSITLNGDTKTDWGIVGYEVSSAATDILTSADAGIRMVYSTTDTKTITLPAATTLGQTYVIIDGSGQNNNKLSVDPATVADTIVYLALDGGDKITSASTGDSVTLVNVVANKWYIESMQGSWTDGGA